MAGKGDKPRPVNKKKFDENYEGIFGPKKKRGKKKPKNKSKKASKKKRESDSNFFKEIY